MKQFYFQTTAALLTGLLLSACSNQESNYPIDYVGFEHSMQSYFYNKNSEKEAIEVKVIAVDKKKEDREVKLSINRSVIPEIGTVYKLNNDRLTIEAGKKEAQTTITLFPKKVIKGEIIQVTCVPLWEGGQASKLSIELMPK